MVILDIDKPECCYNCPCYCGMDGLSFCEASKGEDDVWDPNIIPEWCPMGTLDETVIDIVATKLFERISSKMDERNNQKAFDLHKQTSCPLDECVKASKMEDPIDYLKDKARVRCEKKE